MPDPHRLEGELRTLLSRPQYTSLFLRRAQFCNPTFRHGPNKGKPTPADTPDSIAKATAKRIFDDNLLLDPVEVVEMKGRVELYRLHDGGSHTFSLDDGKTQSKSLSAGTLGACWSDRQSIKLIWDAVSSLPKGKQKQAFTDFFRSANFVLKEWNEMIHVSCLVVPAGARIVVVRGRGSWKAMRTGSKYKRGPDGSAPIHSQGDVIDELRWMPIPGIMQCILPRDGSGMPFFNDLHVVRIAPSSPDWPFLG